MNVSIIGTGYVGLVSGACFADLGHAVTCVDVDAARVEAVNACRSNLHEPGLDDLLQKHVPTGRLRATTDLPAAVRGSAITLLAVPTPFDAAAGRIDLTFVKRAAGQVAEALRDKRDPHAVAVKSTCVPGTAETVVGPILRKFGAATTGVGANPEFLSEGSAVEDFLRPDRIVYGGDERAMEAFDELHAPFDQRLIIRTTAAGAEMVKYASNALLATAISFANEIADLCEATPGTDAAAVMAAVHRSRYLTVNGTQAPLARFLEAGCGYGGSCLPKDTKALAAHAASKHISTPLLDAVTAVNESRPARVLAALRRAGLKLDGARVAVLGTAFKPGTSDVRQSPAVPIIRALLDAGAAVTTFDPSANENTRRLLGDSVEVADSLESAVRGADAVIVATAWPEFAALHEVLDRLAVSPVVYDGRGVLDGGRFARFVKIGRNPHL